MHLPDDGARSAPRLTFAPRSRRRGEPTTLNHAGAASRARRRPKCFCIPGTRPKFRACAFRGDFESVTKRSHQRRFSGFRHMKCLDFVGVCCAGRFDSFPLRHPDQLGEFYLSTTVSRWSGARMPKHRRQSRLPARRTPAEPLFATRWRRSVIPAAAA